MKKTELKTILKPLIKQCVKEALLEEGVLSNVVSEVIKGFSPLLAENNIVPSSQHADKQHLIEEQHRVVEEENYQRLKEQKRKVLNATGFGQEIFEGVSPLSSDGSPSATLPSALSGTDPDDAGIDISGIMAISRNKWKNLV